MLSPEYYEGCADDVLKLYEQLEDDIISDIVRRIMKTGKVTETALHQIEQLQEAGLLYDDILQIIANQTDATAQQVRALFEDAGVETVEIDNEVYHENGLTPVDIRQSPAMRQTLEAGYRKTLGNMKNLTLTTANTSQMAYINACNSAYMQITSGAFSYQEAIRQAIQKTAQTGAMVTYPSGHTERIDVAVRRAVLTGVGQTCREIGIMNAEECGCDLMEISAHSGARPDHAKWQGQLVSLSGKNAGRTISGKKVLSLRQIGYGKGDGFGGWNCRHDWYPFFEGYSKPNYSEKDLQKLDEKNIMYNGKMYSQYEISQIQRRYEREIRAAKREQVAFKVAVDEAKDPELRQVMQDSLNYSNSLVKDKQAKMRDFIRQTGQDRDYFREQNYGRIDYKKNSQDKPVSFTIDEENMQNYKPVELDESTQRNIIRHSNAGYAVEIHAFKAKNTKNNIYISDKAKVKPKFQHEVDIRLSKAYELLNAENENNKPLVCIISGQEMNTTTSAAYNAIQNVLYINEMMIDIEENMEDTGFACPDSKYSTLLHECIHWSDAEKYRQKHRQITRENYGTEYLPKLRKQCKKSLDKLAKESYNISGISGYATEQLEKGNFDETYTEYRVKKRLKGD